MGIIEKDPNNVDITIEISEYENFDFKMIWENKVDISLDNVLSDYNLTEALAAEAEESKRTYEK